MITLLILITMKVLVSLWESLKFLYQICVWVVRFLALIIALLVIDIPMLIIFLIIFLVCKSKKRPTPKLRITRSWIVYPSWKEPIKDISTLSGHEFEHYCAKYLRNNGFNNVRVTRASGDYGADIIATDKHGETWVFQCKRYMGKVGNTAVQEVVAAKAHYNACNAGVMTNSQLTEQARELAFENAVMLFELMG